MLLINFCQRRQFYTLMLYEYYSSVSNENEASHDSHYSCLTSKQSISFGFYHQNWVQNELMYACFAPNARFVDFSHSFATNSRSAELVHSPKLTRTLSLLPSFPSMTIFSPSRPSWIHRHIFISPINSLIFSVMEVSLMHPLGEPLFVLSASKK